VIFAPEFKADVVERCQAGDRADQGRPRGVQGDLRIPPGPSGARLPGGSAAGEREHRL